MCAGHIGSASSIRVSKANRQNVFFFFFGDIIGKEDIYLIFYVKCGGSTPIQKCGCRRRTSFLLSSCLCSTVTHVPAAVSCRNTSMATPDPPATRTLMLSGSKSDRIIVFTMDLLLMTLVLEEDVFVVVVFKEDDDAWYWRDESEREVARLCDIFFVVWFCRRDRCTLWIESAR